MHLGNYGVRLKDFQLCIYEFNRNLKKKLLISEQEYWNIECLNGCLELRNLSSYYTINYIHMFTFFYIFSLLFKICNISRMEFWKFCWFFFSDTKTHAFRQECLCILLGRQSYISEKYSLCKFYFFSCCSLNNIFIKFLTTLLLFKIFET